jgi:FkbM family methyltransferase
MSPALAQLWKRIRKLSRVMLQRDFRAALRRGGVAASVEHERLLRRFACATVIDIGANRGQFALVARQCFPDARIISFEPLPKPQSRFRSVLGHDPRVVLHPVAIGDKAGENVIHVSAADDSSSLLPITALQSELYAGTQEIGTETVRVARLADLVQPGDIEVPALLKIDVQGFELQTLRGCQPLLGSFALIYVECSFVELYRGQALVDDVIAYLREHGFRLEGVYNTSYDSSGRAIQADLLFVPQEGVDAAATRPSVVTAENENAS